MKDCNNCGNDQCYTKINCPEEFHTSPPCTGWKRKKIERANVEISEELKAELDELAEFYEDYDPLGGRYWKE